MLNPLKLTKELQRSLPNLYNQIYTEHLDAQKLFIWLLDHQDEITALTGPTPVPLWQGPLNQVHDVIQQPHPYAVLATDGSQIYPDKHQGVSCYVLNSGVAQFIYGADDADVLLTSEPQIVTQQDETIISEDIVNCHRGQREFEVGLAASKKVCEEHPDKPFVFLCDGSLIFWHLENKHRSLKERFLKRYITLLDEFYQARIPIAGYISLPKSKELVALLKNAKAHKKGPVTSTSFDTLTDTDLIALFLKENQRTTVFTHNSALAQEYPEQIRPCFVYMHMGQEIARVEMPFWVAQDTNLLTMVLQIISDQSVKGNGYPVSLSEAHEQAVIKAHERELFYQLLRTMSQQHNHPMPISQKSLRKRFVSV